LTKKFKKILKEKKIDGALLIDVHSDEPNFFYLSGLHSDCGFLFIPKKGNSKLCVPQLEMEAARKNKKQDVSAVKLERPIHKTLKKAMNSRAKTVGINYCSIRLKTYYYLKRHLKNIKLRDISAELRDLRIQKNPEELKRIKKACRICDRIFSDIISKFSFRTELELKNHIEQRIRKAGCDLAFEPIVASGKNTSMPHHKAEQKRLSKGFLLLDFGAKYKGYCSDMTRMLYLGKPSKKELDHYKRLLYIQTKTIEKAKAGYRISNLEKYCRKLLGRDEKRFIHSLGHGVGVQIHEPPSISIRTKSKIETNSVFTIEPGIYFPGKFGIRIEDCIVINSKGKTEILTRSKKDLVII
jgi:Xaa-Pro aminopeptidase